MFPEPAAKEHAEANQHARHRLQVEHQRGGCKVEPAVEEDTLDAQELLPVVLRGDQTCADKEDEEAIERQEMGNAGIAVAEELLVEGEVDQHRATPASGPRAPAESAAFFEPPVRGEPEAANAECPRGRRR